MVLKGYIFGIGYAAVCLLLSLILYKMGLPRKYTRKAVHILVGFEWVILYHFMGAGLHFLIVCIIFLLLLAIAYKGRLMPMISSDADNAPGTVYYAVAMTGVAAVGCFVPDVMLPFGIGVMCTSVGDGLAGVVGQSIRKHNPRIYSNKTLFGTLTNIVASALFALLISSLYSMELGIVFCLLIGILSAELELVTPYGFDNVSVTWGTTALTYMMMYCTNAQDYLLSIILTPAIIIFALSKRALTLDGIAAAIILDIAVSIAFGNAGFVILCVFFIGSIIIDKIKKRNKKHGRNQKEKKGDCRDYVQVLSNGLPALVTAVAFIIGGHSIYVIPFVASMAEAFADTAASGIGAFAKKTYDPFRLKKCESGLSGGMSVIGTVASLVAAFSVAFIACLIGIGGIEIKHVIIIALSAFLGALIDSMLGSLIQVKYKCAKCGAITEREEHCAEPTVKHSGVATIDNDMVNLISCAAAAVIAGFLSMVI